MELFNRIIELREQTIDINYDWWTNHAIFTFTWWVSVIISVVSIIAWWKFVDKKRFVEILFVGFIAAFLTTTLNDTGLELVLWAYPVQIFGLVRVFIIFDLVVIPVSYMLLYQYFTDWKKYLIAVTVFSAFGSFIAQPLLALINKYMPINWSYLYSFPVYIVMGIIIKAVMSTSYSIQRRSTSHK